MDPISEQALRAALDHETTSIVRQLQADNERLRNELATAKANLANRYLRSVLNLIDKHRDMGSGSLDVIDERLVLRTEGDEDGETHEMLEQLYRFPLEEKLAVIPVLCGLGYWVMHESNIDQQTAPLRSTGTTRKRNSAGSTTTSSIVEASCITLTESLPSAGQLAVEPSRCARP